MSKKRYTKKQLQAVIDEYLKYIPTYVNDKDKLERLLKRLEKKLTDAELRLEKLESLPMLIELIGDDFNRNYTDASSETIVNVLATLMYVANKKGVYKNSKIKPFEVDGHSLIKYVEKESKNDIELYKEWRKWVKPGKYPIIPVNILDEKEEKSVSELTKRYEKLMEPTAIGKATEKIKEKIPQKIKEILEEAGHSIENADLYNAVMKRVAEGFDILVKNAAKVTISEKDVVNQINNSFKENHIFTIDEVCFARGYDVQKIVSKFKTQNVFVALAEGGITGAAGLPGIPLNIASSLFIFYRAVQSIAMYYGYDVRNNAEELEIATSVFMQAMDPKSGSSSEMGDMIAKIMAMSEAIVVRQTASKGWKAMAEHGGLTLLLAQIRAIAHKAAKTALEKAGQKGLEFGLFEGVIKVIGKKLTQDAIKKGVTPAAAIITALMDVSTMNKVLEYADIFYNKRFLAEKQARIEMLEDSEHIQDVEYETIDQ